MLMKNKQDDFPIYRIMSIYEFYELYKNNRLKLTQYAKQLDKDDGLESSIFTWFLKGNCENNKEGNKQDSFQENHERVRNTHYMTCWTSEKESEAMWKLYSPHQESVQIKTTLSKLKDVLTEYQKKNPPDYINFKKNHVKESDLIKASYRDFTEIEKFIAEKNTVEIFNIQRDIIDKKCFPKNISFSYENELRGVVVLEAPYNNDELPEEVICSLKNGRGIPSEYPDYNHHKKIKFPAVLFAETDFNFIEEISFDPRTPEYIRDTLINMLDIDKKIINSSNTFRFITN